VSALVRRALMAAARRRAGASDPLWGSVVSLLSFDGDIVDAKGIAWTAVGNAAPNGPAKFGTFGLITDGSGDRLITTSTDNIPLRIGANEPFTYEGWNKMPPQAVGLLGAVVVMGNGHVANSGLSIFQQINSGTQLNIAGYGNANTVITTNVGTDVYHWTMVGRQNSGVDVYIKGTRYITNYPRNGIELRGNIWLGDSYFGPGNAVPMGFDETRLTKAERYFGPSFTVPTGPFPRS
jgi:hypothetical protein